MTFREMLSEVIDWLQKDQRISHRALQRQFDLDDVHLQDEAPEYPNQMVKKYPDGRRQIVDFDMTTGEEMVLRDLS